MHYIRERVSILTQHYFIGGDNDIEFECIWDDLPAGFAVVELIFVDESTAVDATMVDDHVELAPRLKLPLPVGDG